MIVVLFFFARTYYFFPFKKMILTTLIPIFICIVQLEVVVGNAVFGGIYLTELPQNVSGIDYRYRISEPFDRAAYTALGESLVTDFKILPDQVNNEGPGIAAIDIDKDGYLDLYVTRKDHPNTLYRNLLGGGTFEFEEVAATRGLDATGHDSLAVCYGDVDNDEDMDILVVSFQDPWRLYENDGTGYFTDVSVSSGIDAIDGKGAAGCTFGDVDGDGYNDLYVHRTRSSCPDLVPSDPTETLCELCAADKPANILVMNQGDGTFVNAPARGLNNPAPGPFNGFPLGAHTWASTLVDIDNDGDLDAVDANDACFIQAVARLFLNNGTGYFDDVTDTNMHLDAKGNPVVGGGFMGHAWADFDYDGNVDLFMTDFGPSFLAYITHFPVPHPDHSSRVFNGNGQGKLIDDTETHVNGEQGPTPFGFGCVAADFDNNGATDVVYYGGLFGTNRLEQLADNPGVLLLNDGTGQWTYDATAQRDHRGRQIQGVATGDFNNDGFPDVASVSRVDFDAADVTLFEDVSHPLALKFPLDNEFSTNSGLIAQVETDGALPGHGTWKDLTLTMGMLSLEINSGDNGNNFISLRARGSVGAVTGASNSRDGFGAILHVTPAGGQTSIVPVVGGDSRASQSESSKIFGLGDADEAQVDVAWLGGTTNRYPNVSAGDHVEVREIPCDIKSQTWANQGQFVTCVVSALNELKNAGFYTGNTIGETTISMIGGYAEYHP